METSELIVHLERALKSEDTHADVQAIIDILKYSEGEGGTEGGHNSDKEDEMAGSLA